ncbi:MAG: sulfite exporter TauE/SafE family protein [Alphaproteobacteria bacterium]|nr:sulfite exporter TauE/SafE family protein [Alphaproteobacteria bacterium]
MEFIADPLFYAIAVPAVLIVGISKGGVAGGLGSVSVPMMALAISPIQAAAILLPILCLMDLFGLHAYRGIWDRRNLALMLPGALAGILVGTLTFRYLSDDGVRLIVGVVALGFVVWNWLGPKLLRRAADHRTEPGPAGLFWAGISGFTSFIAHAGGPPVHVYLLPQRIDKTLYVGTLVVFFTAVNYTKLVPYGLLGQLSANNLGTALILSPLAPVGIWLGVRFHRMLSESLFYKLCFVFLSLTGVKLIWDGLSGMMGG